jgi:hypothetical protein
LPSQTDASKVFVAKERETFVIGKASAKKNMIIIAALNNILSEQIFIVVSLIIFSSPNELKVEKSFSHGKLLLFFATCRNFTVVSSFFLLLYYFFFCFSDEKNYDEKVLSLLMI